MILTGLSLALNNCLVLASDATSKPSSGDSSRGQKLYGASCIICHSPQFGCMWVDEENQSPESVSLLRFADPATDGGLFPRCVDARNGARKEERLQRLDTRTAIALDMTKV